MRPSLHPRLALLSAAPLLLTRPLPRAGDDPPPTNPADLAKKYDGDLVRMAGDMVELGRKLNTAERKRDDFERELGDTKKLIPADGSRVLTKEQGVEWDAYVKLGSVKDVGEAITERDDLKGKLTTSEASNAKMQRTNTLRDIAGDMAWKGSVLTKLDALTPGLEYFQKPEQVDNKTVQVWYVKYKKGEGDAATTEEEKLSDYAENNTDWKEFSTSLVLPTDDDKGAQHIEQGSGGTKHVEQGSGGKSGKKDIFAGIREKNAKEAEVAKEKSSPSLEQIMNIGTNAGA